MSMLKLAAYRCAALAAVAAAMWATGVSALAGWTGMAAAAVAVYVLTGGHYTLYLVWHTLPRDARGAFRYLRLLFLVYNYQRRNLTVPRVFRHTVDAFSGRTCLIFEDRKWTFLELDEYSNRVAHYFLRMGYKPGDCIALFMENRPEYVGIWLGCAKVGVVPALINTNLSGRPLLHSINSAEAIACIYGTELAKAVDEVLSECPDVRLYHSGACPAPNGHRTHIPAHSVNLDHEVINSSGDEVPESLQKCTNFNDKLLYIYTSGLLG
jgi:solute carrier family 27 fatty acid transporter 1/4